MSIDNLPVKKENFLAEVEVMNLAPIKGSQFLVAVSTGDPSGIKFLSSSVHGPYSFVEMLQEVGEMWSNHQHHARVVILDKDSNKAVKTLDENTVDYIECHYMDIITEEMLGGAFDDTKVYTCAAGMSSEEASSDPRHKSKEIEEDASEQDTLP